jgi:hypothetical protein
MTALTLLERHAAHVPWERIGATTFGLDELNEALADAEALKFSKALVRPRARSVRYHRRADHTEIP